MAIVPHVSDLAPRLPVLCFGDGGGGVGGVSVFNNLTTLRNFESRPIGACMQAIMKAISLAFDLCYQDGVATFKSAVFFYLDFSLMLVWQMFFSFHMLFLFCCPEKCRVAPKM